MKPSFSRPLSLTCCLVVSLLQSPPASAQVTPDGTTSTTVNVDGNNFEINDGDRAGSNLFHSFQDFSVPTGSEAFFNNANDISNIFSRVTGGSVSNIDGLIKASGSANLFLINPAGIVFGQGARLDIGGSFYGSTADSLLFPEGEFSAVDLDNPPLLTINAPIGLGFRDNPGNIVNRSDLDRTVVKNEGTEFEFTLIESTMLEVGKGKNIALIGGNVFMENSVITAPGGRVTLGGISQAGIVTFNADNSFNFPEGIEAADVSLIGIFNNSNSLIDVRSNTGGFVDINARNLVIERSDILLGIESGLSDSVAGDINLTADSIALTNSSIDSMITSGQGRVGDINFSANSISLNFASIGSTIYSEVEGEIGDINLTADSISSNVALINSIISSETGVAGDINLTADSISLTNSNIESRVSSRESQGDINLVADSIILNNSDLKSAIYFTGTTGRDINLTANSLSLTALASIESDIFLGVSDLEKNLGDINLNTNVIYLNNGRIASGANVVGRFDSNLNFKNINFGDININTNFLSLYKNSLIISGLNNYLVTPGGVNVVLENLNFGKIDINTDAISLNNSLIISDANIYLSEGQIFFRGELNLGDINLDANSVLIDNNSGFITRTNTPINAFNIDIKATNSIEISGINSIISSQTGNSGNTGDLKIKTSELRILDGGQININNFITETFEISSGGIFTRNILEQLIEGSGNGETINITANNIFLEDRGGIVALSSSGEGGNIQLQADNLLSLRDNSEISAMAGVEGIFGNGSNVDIDANFIVAFPNGNNDITANAFDGNGGSINIITEGIFGIKEQSQNERTKELIASLKVDGLDSSIVINAYDLNSIKTDLDLPDRLIESEQITTQTCQSDRAIHSGEANRPAKKPNSLIIEGKGGVPPEPTEPLNSDAILVNGKITNPNLQTQHPDIKPIATSNGYIVPARSIVKTEDGRIILTGYPTDNAHQRTPNIRANCTR